MLGYEKSFIFCAVENKILGFFFIFAKFASCFDFYATCGYSNLVKVAKAFY